MKTFFFHLMPYADLDLTYTDRHNSAWVTLPNSYFDPAVGQKLYRPLYRRAGTGRSTRLRRHLRERAPSDRLWPDAGAQPDRGGARALDQAGQDRDPRPGAAAGEQSGGDRGRIRHARPDERRPHHHRLRARHRHRIFRQRRQSHPLARPLLRGARADPAGVDRDRAVPLPRPALPVRLRQPVAAAVAAAAPAGVDSLAGELRDRRMVRVGQAQIHLSADLQPGEVGEEGVRSLSPGGGARRLRIRSPRSSAGRFPPMSPRPTRSPGASSSRTSKPSSTSSCTIRSRCGCRPAIRRSLRPSR